MDPNDLLPEQEQLRLFNLGDTSTGMIELFPAVWGAIEGLIRPEVNSRRLALQELSEMGAARYSPLVIYVLATRMTDPDIETRRLVVNILGDVLVPDENGNSTPDGVLFHLTTYLSQMRTRQVYALLQVLEYERELSPAIKRMLNACPYAGTHLVDILFSRKAPLGIRLQAVRLIGEVGYLDAMPALDRLQARIESRQNGQQRMSFAPSSGEDELALLPAIKHSLAVLRSP